MPDEKLPLLAQGGVPAFLAGLLQIGMALAIGKMPPATQVFGAILVAGLVGGGMSILCVEAFHLGSTISGIIGGASGAVPAVFWANVAQTVARQQVKQRFGVDELQGDKPKAPTEGDQDA